MASWLGEAEAVKANEAAVRKQAEANETSLQEAIQRIAELEAEIQQFQQAKSQNAR